ncbi:MAG: glycine--tRNA ligase subunit beta [Planctomycetes bacterium]|nr:glycine--tRNA ligase subunit beta [Planctomycetota bacterium]
MPNLLLEIGTEEIPAGYLTPALAQMEQSFKALLEESRLACGKIYTTGTPRRMVLFAAGLPLSQTSFSKEILGPKIAIAFKEDGKPTEALIGFARRYQTKPEDVKVKDSDKGKVCYILQTVRGEKIEAVLARIIPALINKLSFPKSMWWQDKAFSFARPIRSLVVLLGRKVIKISLSDIASSNKTRGHHILNNKPITISSADYSQYKKALLRASVMVDHDERREEIHQLLLHALKKHGSKFTETELLDEVTNLVEYPEVLECEFEHEFLALPAAVLESAMKSHQRYFPVRDVHNKLLSKFIVITNGGKDRKLVREGNERVLRARLTDARFFWEKDKKIPLASKTENLKQMAFLGRLGSFYDKSQRIKQIGLFICSELNYGSDITLTVSRAAELCKTDLLTEMVGEFPDLQGIMGYEYSRIQGAAEEVAIAIKEHYLPRTADDAIPKSTSGIVLSLAEKFDNITACFVAGFEPTGSQDPYAVRRQVLGVIRIIEENGLPLPSIRKLMLFALEQIQRTIQTLADKNRIQFGQSREYADKIMAFFQERLINRHVDEQHPHDLVQAVLNSGFDNMSLFKTRLKDLVKLHTHASWPKLVEVVERTYNIQKASQASGAVRDELLREKEEHILWEAYRNNKDQIQSLISQQKYYDASILYAKVFAEPVHTFFDKVFVNVPDQMLKNNRILMMRHINKLYSEHIADLSQVVSGKATVK